MKWTEGVIRAEKIVDRWCRQSVAIHPTSSRTDAQPCAAVLVLRLAAVRLAAPLGDRVVLDAETGRPVTEEPA
jgi:hypothetical protein